MYLFLKFQFYFGKTGQWTLISICIEVKLGVVTNLNYDFIHIVAMSSRIHITLATKTM